MFCEMATMQMLLVLVFLITVEPFNLNRVMNHHYGAMRSNNAFNRGTKSVLALRNVLVLSSTEPLMEDGVTLNSLQDTNSDGTFLKESIQRWLDEEYIPQDVHATLGEEVKKVYIAKRREGN